jgi:vitamin B12 transporter
LLAARSHAVVEASSADAVLLDDVLVTATRTPLRPDQVASAVTVLTHEDVVRSGARDLAALLEQVPSLDLSRAGGPGGTATLRIRGMGDGQVLLLIDGVEQNDPSSPGRAVDLSTIALLDVERVEIVRGPQSALYGADAMAGVVQVITRPIESRSQVGLSLGSLGQRALQLGSARRLGPLGLSLHLTHEALDGVSAAQDASGEDSDGLTSTHARLAVELRPRPGLTITGSLAGETSRTELDNFGGTGGDDPNSQGRTRRVALSSSGSWEALGGNTQWQLWRQDTRRLYDNPVDADHPLESLDARYEGRVTHAGLQHARRVAGGHDLLAALEWEGERSDSKSHSLSAWGPYDESVPAQRVHGTALVLQERWSRGPLHITASGRKDWHGGRDDRLTGRITLGVGILRGSYGTGFKAPSLYQLHSVYGDPSLKAEASRGWDLGVDLHGPAARASLGYFRNDVREQIEFGPLNRYVNIGRARTRGFELEASGSREWLAWSASLQRQQALDLLTNQELLRRPATQARLGLEAQGAVGSLGLAWRWEGARADLHFDEATWTRSRVELAGFALVDVRLARRLHGLTAWLKLENALDRHYQEVLGYRSPGRVWRLGLDWMST